MRIGEKLGTGGRIFIKSEWNQINNDWPCLSYSKSKVGEELREKFVPNRDILIYVGVSDTKRLIDETYKSSLISAVQVQPKQVLSSKKIVSPELWKKSLELFGERWQYAIPVLWSANFIGPPYPPAHKVFRKAYNFFSYRRNWGQVVEVEEESEKANVMELEVIQFPLTYTHEVIEYMKLEESYSNKTPGHINKAATRMAELIRNRVQSSQNSNLSQNPIRTSPEFSVLFKILVQKLKIQSEMCALCGGVLDFEGINPMLQPSPDRIDSGNTSYEDSNLQVTHLACNLAKNNNCEEKFQDWLNVVRDVEYE